MEQKLSPESGKSLPGSKVKIKNKNKNKKQKMKEDRGQSDNTVCKALSHTRFYTWHPIWSPRRCQVLIPVCRIRSNL